ncbi:glycosyltransferase family 2 protein [Leucobacter weissii]|uniref:Glycosyltransferase family 2 protein n=1 Tax=Leucobacter weissii TaxID=1983706 RepID=A0A939ML95_9MICO|nr:glycosyltransferase family 2 protein [Leucobacter weissii]MBO1900887.1 glycosyltransferase family 2 protein [Leucobacter weissii]
MPALLIGLIGLIGFAGRPGALGTSGGFAQWWRETGDFLFDLYGGLPWWAVPLFWVALVIILVSTVSLLALTVSAQLQLARTARARRRYGDPAESEADYLWVFMVPALNEEVTIADSVGRLSEVRATHKRILVVNDGSDDRTGQILASLDVPELTVLTRTAPEARQGKSEALNDAWRYLHREVLGAGVYGGWDPRRVIVTIVDADGRLDARAARVSRLFDDPRVGGVQALVRIYNRRSFLTWAQDIEFGVFGHLFQMGRMSWGTANMGGNGQFNRLAALDEVAVENRRGQRGPWREGRLTEDQDIGLRMIERGWRGAQSTTVTVHQQGLNSLRALYRQRTRWSQGGWQMLDLSWRMLRNPSVGIAGRWDQFWYLLNPLVQAWMGLTVLLTVVFVATQTTRVQPSVLFLLVLYLFAVFPVVWSVVFARRRFTPLKLIADVLLAHLYVFYSWLIYPVVYRALLRQLMGLQRWAKTEREAIEGDPPD